MENGEDDLEARARSGARALSLETGERPTAAAIAVHAGISLADVHHALALAKVMQR